MRILIVEDEQKLAGAMKQGLERHGFAADYVTDGETAERRIEIHHVDYDLIILDLLLPKKTGLEVCRATRARGIRTPILILTARSGTDDKIGLLDAGADDYLTKPFSFEELIARIRALLRRPSETLPPKLELRDVVLDPSTHEVYRKNRKIPLTVKEFTILEYLMRHPNQVLSRENIISHVWGFDFDSFSNVVDVHIKNLRKKIEPQGYEKLVETIAGVGYRISA